MELKLRQLEWSDRGVSVWTCDETEKYRSRASRPRVMIELQDGVTHDVIRRAAVEAMLVHNRNVKEHGPRGWRFHFLEKLLAEHYFGASYAQVAEAVNRTITVALRFEWRTGEPPSTGAAEDMLDALGFRKPEIRRLLQEARARLAAREAPFDRDEPVSAEKMRSALRVWRGGSAHQSWMGFARRVAVAERAQPDGKRPGA